MKKNKHYLGLAKDRYIGSEDIIGVFDLDHCTVSKRGKEYLNNLEKKGLIIYDGTELPKSFIIKRDKRVVLSQYNTSTIVQKERVIDVATTGL